ncbi:hypothetical protein [Clostridium sp. ATCC 25772]|uniref:hypothetical protein n=1 Tax=Clostridium sp. ATCC 25772 TaxID=1676991 RepID=UPI000780F124|nr:hypothetical protein [Clostridium sp. ATCC 25772]
MKKAITVRMDESVYNSIANDADRRKVSINRALNDKISETGSTLNVQGDFYSNCNFYNSYPRTNSTNENSIIEDVPFRED